MNDKRNNEDVLSLTLLRKLYSLSKEEYELAFETDFVWELPYEAIKEFLKPIILVFNATFVLEETIGFIKYYFDNQSEYPKEYPLSNIQKELIELVGKEELTRGEFCSSCQVLVKNSFIDINTTEKTEFMIEKAQIFIGKIALKDSTLSKEYKLREEKFFEEKFLEEMSERGYYLIQFN